MRIYWYLPISALTLTIIGYLINENFSTESQNLTVTDEVTGGQRLSENSIVASKETEYSYTKSSNRQGNSSEMSLARQVDTLNSTGLDFKVQLSIIVVKADSDEEVVELFDALITAGHEAYPALGSLLNKVYLIDPKRADETIDHMIEALDESDNLDFVSDVVGGLFNVRYKDFTEKIAVKLSYQTSAEKRRMIYGLLAANRYSIEQDQKYRKMASEDSDPLIQNLAKDWSKFRMHDLASDTRNKR